MGKVIRFVKQETVLSVAAVLAAASAFAVPPDAGYAGYIDWRTMAILFSLMTVMAGLRRGTLLYGDVRGVYRGAAHAHSA